METAQIFSQIDQVITTWNIENTDETDEGGNVHSVIKATYNDEVLRYSPNYTDEELSNTIAAYNSEKQQ